MFRRPSNRHRAVPLTPAEFHYAFANTVSRAESDSWHAKLAIPAPGRPLFQSALANFTPKSKAATVVDYAKPDRAPLLLIAGGRDHIVPSSVVYENFTRYRRSAARDGLQAVRGPTTFDGGVGRLEPTWPTTR